MTVPKPFVPKYPHSLGEWGLSGKSSRGTGSDVLSSSLDMMLGGHQSYQERLYTILRALAMREGEVLRSSLREARIEILDAMAAEIVGESSKKIFTLLSEVQSLVEIEEVQQCLYDYQREKRAEAAFGSNLSDDGGKAKIACALLETWNRRGRRKDAEGGGEEFELIEAVLAVREVLVRILTPELFTTEHVIQQLAEISTNARNSKHVNVAMGAIYRAEQIIR